MVVRRSGWLVVEFVAPRDVVVVVGIGRMKRQKLVSVAADRTRAATKPHVARVAPTDDDVEEDANVNEIEEDGVGGWIENEEVYGADVEECGDATDEKRTDGVNGDVTENAPLSHAAGSLAYSLSQTLHHSPPMTN